MKSQDADHMGGSKHRVGDGGNSSFTVLLPPGKWEHSSCATFLAVQLSLFPSVFLCIYIWMFIFNKLLLKNILKVSKEFLVHVLLQHLSQQLSCLSNIRVQGFGSWLEPWLQLTAHGKTGADCHACESPRLISRFLVLVLALTLAQQF